MREAYAQAAVCHHLGQGGRDGEAPAALARARIALSLSSCCRRGGCDGDVEVAFDELEVGREVLEEGVDGGRGEVAEAEDLADFAGGKEFLELLVVLVT